VSSSSLAADLGRARDHPGRAVRDLTGPSDQPRRLVRDERRPRDERGGAVGHGPGPADDDLRVAGNDGDAGHHRLGLPGDDVDPSDQFLGPFRDPLDPVQQGLDPLGDPADPPDQPRHVVEQGGGAVRQRGGHADRVLRPARERLRAVDGSGDEVPGAGYGQSRDAQHGPILSYRCPRGAVTVMGSACCGRVTTAEYRRDPLTPPDRPPTFDRRCRLPAQLPGTAVSTKTSGG
jgi:hypothetical protein